MSRTRKTIPTMYHKSNVKRKRVINEARMPSFSEMIESLESEVTAYGIEQAIEHGHPSWSHEYAYGPCTRED
jgi:hypothetical protein